MRKNFHPITILLVLCISLSGNSKASFHLWDISEIYSNADGTVQYIELETTFNNQGLLSGHSISANSDGNTVTYNITTNVSSSTANQKLLFGTAALSAQDGGITPDYVIPDQFFNPNANSITIDFAGVDSVSFASSDLPVETYLAIDHSLAVIFNSPTNFAGEVGALGDLIFVDHFEVCQLAYPDLDGDQFGDLNDPGVAMCVLQVDFSYNNLDCNDGDSNINPSATDLPDNNRIDSNCDGTDGDISQAIFASPIGSSQGDGSMNDPVDTLNGAITLAILNSKSQVYAATGLFNEMVELADGVSLYGGYAQGNGWLRGMTQTSILSIDQISDQRIGVNGQNINSPTTFDFFEVVTNNANAPGASNYGLRCVNCDGLTISNNSITAGNASNGLNGQPGLTGSNGINGNNGTNGCSGNTNCGFGGPTRSSPIGEFGGQGGDGGYDSGGGQNGSFGSSGAQVGMGAASSECFNGGNPGSTGGNGANGSDGSDGDNGIGYTIINNFWVGNTGETGTDGTNGKGGSGGGGGGGGTDGGGFCTADKGGGGGSGGSGGGGGLGGSGGQAGGSSFAIFLINSNNATLQSNNLNTGLAGIGGTGGPGGNGGDASTGGVPGTGSDDSGPGGAGGTGGAGGNGGDGGDGADGLAQSIFIQ